MTREPGEVADMRRALGIQLATFRKAAEMTQADLATLVFCDRTTVAHIEAGRARADERFWQTVDRATSADGVLINGYRSLTTAKHAHEHQLRDSALTHIRRQADALRKTGAAEAQPAAFGFPDPLVPDIGYDEAAVLVNHAHRCYQGARYRELTEFLPRLIDAVDALVVEESADRQRKALRLQCSASIVAAKLATKKGDGATASVAADRARNAAMLADDPFGQAAAGYQIACALLATGRSEAAERIAVGAVETLKGLDPQSVTWRGSLTLIAAIIAARHADRATCNSRLDEAHRLAQHLGDDGNIGWTAFGPTNVRIHRMSAAAVLDDPRATLTIAEQIDIATIPNGLRGRQAQFYLDSAWAYSRLNEDTFSLIQLLDAERVAPELTYNSQSARTLITNLLGRERRRHVPGLRGLARRAGVAD